MGDVRILLGHVKMWFRKSCIRFRKRPQSKLQSKTEFNLATFEFYLVMFAFHVMKFARHLVKFRFRMVQFEFHLVKFKFNLVKLEFEVVYFKGDVANIAFALRKNEFESVREHFHLIPRMSCTSWDKLIVNIIDETPYRRSERIIPWTFGSSHWLCSNLNWGSSYVFVEVRIWFGGVWISFDEFRNRLVEFRTRFSQDWS